MQDLSAALRAHAYPDFAARQRLRRVNDDPNRTASTLSTTESQARDCH